MSDNKELNSANNLKRYHKRRAFGIAKLGGKCVQCSSVKNLEFDHIDPTTKTISLGKEWSVPLERFLLELEKCQLLCKSCHKEKTSKERKVEIHGTWGMYRNRKCRCDTCKTFVNAYQKEYKRKRRAEFPY